MEDIIKDEFAVYEGFENWQHAMDNLSKCDNGYLLSEFIDKYIKKYERT